MSESSVLARLSKCGGDLHAYRRRFDRLPSKEAKRAFCLLIDAGEQPERAMRSAKRGTGHSLLMEAAI